MYNWRLLLLAFTAVIQPIASFTERSFVDGRQQCCDHRLSKDLHGNDLAKELSEHRRVSLNREARPYEPREENFSPNRLKIEGFGRSGDLTRVSPEFGARSLRTDVRRVRETPDLAGRNTRHVFRESSYERQSREDQRFIETRQPTQRQSSNNNEAQRSRVTREIRNEVNRGVDTVRTERSAIQNERQKEYNDKRTNYRSEREMKLQTRLINVQDEPTIKSRNVRRVTRDINSFETLGSRMDSRQTRNAREGNIERSSSLDRRDDERIRNIAFGNMRNFRSDERREGQMSTRRVTVQTVSLERVRSDERMSVVKRPLTHKSSVSETELREINVDDRTARLSSRAKTTGKRHTGQNERRSATKRREVRENTQRNLNADNKRIERLSINRKSQDIPEKRQRDSTRSLSNLRSYDESRLQSNERRTVTNRLDINKKASQTERTLFNDQTRRSVDDRKIQRVRFLRESGEVHSTTSRSNYERRVQSNRDEHRNNDERQLRSVSNERDILTVRSQVNERKLSNVNSRKADSRANRQARELFLERRNSDSDRSSLTTRNYDNHRMQSVRNERGIADRRQLNSLTIVQNRDEGSRINRQARDLTQVSRISNSDRSSSMDRSHEERRLHYVRNKAERLGTDKGQRYDQRRFTVDERVEGTRRNRQVRGLSHERQIENSGRSSFSAKAREVRQLQLVRTDRRVLDEQLVRERKNINDQRSVPINDVDRMRSTRRSRSLSQERRSYDSDNKFTSDARIYDERRLKSERRMSAEHERVALEPTGTPRRDERISLSIHSRLFSQARRSLRADRRSSKAINYEERRGQSIRYKRAVLAERWEIRKEQRRGNEYNSLGERFERVRISRRSGELSQERQSNGLRRVSKDIRVSESGLDSRQLQERQESNFKRHVNYNDEMRTRTNARRDISDADDNKHSVRNSQERKEFRDNNVISYSERNQQRVRTVSRERQTEATTQVTERNHGHTNQRTIETSKVDTPTRRSAVVKSRGDSRISERMASRKISNAELTRKQTLMYSEKSMETYENTWQYLIYTIQAIYLCSIIMPTLMDLNGNTKKKYTNIGLWMPLQKLLKVD